MLQQQGKHLSPRTADIGRRGISGETLREIIQQSASDTRSRAEGAGTGIWAWMQRENNQQTLDDLIWQNMQPFKRVN